MTLMRDVRRATARVAGCRPRDVRVSTVRIGGWHTATTRIPNGGSLTVVGRDRITALRNRLDCARRALTTSTAEDRRAWSRILRGER